MKRRLFTLLMALIMALTPALSLAEKADSAKERLLSLWSEYLAIEDKIIQDDLIVCDALTALDASRTWEQMLRTRAAVAAALSNRSALGSFSLGENLTPDEEMDLIEQGVDVDPFVMEMEGLNGYLGVELSTLLQFSLTLIGDSFDTKSLSWTKDWAVLKKATF